MMLKFIIMLLAFCFYKGTNENYSGDICWSENYRLNWSDFLGIPDSTVFSPSTKAVTAYQLSRIYLIDAGLPSYRVKVLFLRSKSWTRDTVSISLLNHEQGHFDIAELHARKIRDGITILRLRGVQEKRQYADLISEGIKELDTYQDDYDKETRHGSIDIIQKDWDARISQQLKSSWKYKSDSEDCEK